MLPFKNVYPEAMSRAIREKERRKKIRSDEDHGWGLEGYGLGTKISKWGTDNKIPLLHDQSNNWIDLRFKRYC